MNFVFASAAKQSSFKKRDCFTAFAKTNLRLYFDEFIASAAKQSSAPVAARSDRFTAFAMTNFRIMVVAIAKKARVAKY